MKKEEYDALVKNTEEQLRKIADRTKRLSQRCQSFRCEDPGVLADLEEIVTELLSAISTWSQKHCRRCPLYPNDP